MSGKKINGFEGVIFFLEKGNDLRQCMTFHITDNYNTLTQTFHITDNYNIS